MKSDITKPERYYCQKCGKELEKNNRPCLNCGCTNVFIKKSLEGELTFKGFRKIRKKLESFKKFAIEIITGWRPSRDKKKYPEGVKIDRIIDRKNLKKEDSYQEKIIDVKTGKICRDVKEPLSQHRHKQV